MEILSFPPSLLLSLVPRAGVEPARVAPLVFETSASTDSAIYLGSKAGAKIQHFLVLTKKSVKKLKNTCGYHFFAVS